MPFCSKCGTQLGPQDRFCPNCGAVQVPETAYSYVAPDPMDVAGNRGKAVLSYFGLLVLIPIFAGKYSPYARFHANQGLVLLIAEVLYSIVESVIMNVGGWLLIPTGLMWLLSMALNLVGLAIFVLAVLGIYNAAKGLMKELPIIGKIRLLK